MAVSRKDDTEKHAKAQEREQVALSKMIGGILISGVSAGGMGIGFWQQDLKTVIAAAVIGMVAAGIIPWKEVRGFVSRWTPGGGK